MYKSLSIILPLESWRCECDIWPLDAKCLDFFRLAVFQLLVHPNHSVIEYLVWTVVLTVFSMKDLDEHTKSLSSWSGTQCLSSYKRFCIPELHTELNFISNLCLVMLHKFFVLHVWGVILLWVFLIFPFVLLILTEFCSHKMLSDRKWHSFGNKIKEKVQIALIAKSYYPGKDGIM